MLFTYVLKIMQIYWVILNNGPKFPLLKANMLPNITPNNKVFKNIF